MKARQVTLKIAHVANLADVWDEVYTEGARSLGFPKGHADPEQWGKELIEAFNGSLRPWDKERVLVSAGITEVEVEGMLEDDADEDEDVDDDADEDGDTADVFVEDDDE